MHILQDCSPRLMEALKDWDEPMKRAEAELKYMEDHGIRALTLTDEDYPQRLSECPDAPIILYYKGNADLNQRRIISIVGTRHCTTYGQDLIRHFIADLHYYCPKVLVVSGLAYGVDINAHRQALANGYPPIARHLPMVIPPWECWLTDWIRSILTVIVKRRQRCSVKGDCSRSS